MQDLTIDSRGSTFLLSGELDMESAPALRAAMASAVTIGGPITLDFSGVTFMDSTGLHVLLAALHDLVSGCIIIHGVHDNVARVLDVSGLSRMEELHLMPCAVLV